MDAYLGKTHPQAGHQAGPGAESLPAASWGLERSRWGGGFKEAAPAPPPARAAVPSGTCSSRLRPAGRRGRGSPGGNRTTPLVGGGGAPGGPSVLSLSFLPLPATPAPLSPALTSVAAVAEGRGTVCGRGAGAAGRAGS